MDMVVWIIVCLFACVGFVQILAWGICFGKRRKSGSFRLIVLEEDPEQLDIQLENCMLQVAWGIWSEKDMIFLADSGTEDAVRAQCRQLFGEGYPVFVCGPEDLAEMVKSLKKARVEACSEQ